MASISPRAPMAWRMRRKTLERLLEYQHAVLDAGRETLRDCGRTEHAEVRDTEEKLTDSMRLGVDVTVLELSAQTACGIDAALWRLGAGKFGRCADCGVTIAARRLEALFFAERCYACQEVCDLVTSVH
jgi:RNA polymerase-binding transcription factor DksA